MGRDGIRIQKSCPSSAGDCLNRVVASRAQITQMTQMVQWIVNLAPLKCKKEGGMVIFGDIFLFTYIKDIDHMGTFFLLNDILYIGRSIPINGNFRILKWR